MNDSIIWYILSFGCAILFYAIGIYAQKIEKPMWFWSGTTVNPDEITDVKKYNRENSAMWKLYSLWFWAAGFSKIRSSTLAILFLVLGCTIGIALLVFSYEKIYKKYKAQ